MEEVTSTKIGALVLLIVLRLFSGLIPIVVFEKLKRMGNNLSSDPRKNQRSQRRKNAIELFLSVLMCFGAGLLLATCFMHMIPEVRAQLSKKQVVAEWPILEDFPIAEFILVVGFFLVYLMEELGEWLLAQTNPEPSNPTVAESTSQDKSKEPAKGTWTRNMGARLSGRLTSASRADLMTSSLSLNSPSLPPRSPAESVEAPPVTATPEYKFEYSKERVQAHPLEDSHQHSHQHHGHGHSHGIPLDTFRHKTVMASIRGLLVVIALSFHSVFEGMAIGLQDKAKDVWFLFAAVSVHELAIVFCVGIELLTAGVQRGLYIFYMITLGLVTPVGVGIAMIVTELSTIETPTHILVIGVLQGIASGTILYVVFFEIMERERQKHKQGLLKWFFIVVGFGLMVVSELAGGHSHADEDGHTVLPNGTNSSLLLYHIDHSDHSGHSH